MIRARKGPVLTVVPQASLKSSSSRPSKTKPRCGRAFVGETQGIAEAIEAVFVEGGSRQLVVAPIARRDIRAFDARFIFSADRHELQLIARAAAGRASAAMDRLARHVRPKQHGRRVSVAPKPLIIATRAPQTLSAISSSARDRLVG